MQITLDIPDDLASQLNDFSSPQQLILKLLNDHLKNQDDPWSNPELELPSTDAGITDFAANHDHYLYGNEKQT